MTELQYAIQAGLAIEIKKDNSGEEYATWKVEGYGAGAYYLNEEEKQMVMEYNGKEVEEAKTLEEVLVELFGEKIQVKSVEIKDLLSEKVLNVEKIGKGLTAKYVFKVANDNSPYRLSATLTGKGKWWVKRGRSGY